MPHLSTPRIFDSGKGWESTPTRQAPPLGISRDDGNLQLPSVSLAPEEVEIQLPGEKVYVPGKDKRDAASVQQTKPVPDRG
jgi:hypothetical protein